MPQYVALPVWIIPAGCQSQITLVQCRGAKSHVYDMYTGQGVVSSRAVFVYCDLLRLSYDRVFCLPTYEVRFNLLARGYRADAVCNSKFQLIGHGLGAHKASAPRHADGMSIEYERRYIGNAS